MGEGHRPVSACAGEVARLVAQEGKATGPASGAVAVAGRGGSRQRSRWQCKAARRSKHELLESAAGKAGKGKSFCGDRDQYLLQ